VQILRLTEIFSGVGPRPEVTFHIRDPKPGSGHSLKQKKIIRKNFLKLFKNWSFRDF
jgi:hypothetical protein